MREIKFKVWDKSNPEKPMMWTNTLTAKDVWEIGYEAKEHEYHAGNYEGEAEYSFKDCEFLQFTGLKDKNGVEIFEGDILKTKENPKKYCDKCQAETSGRFCGSCGNEAEDRDDFKIGVCVYSRCKFSIRRLYEGFDFTIEYGICEIYIQSIEVIGNVYQNPELLTKP